MLTLVPGNHAGVALTWIYLTLLQTKCPPAEQWWQWPLSAGQSTTQTRCKSISETVWRTLLKEFKMLAWTPILQYSQRLWDVLDRVGGTEVPPHKLQDLKVIVNFGICCSLLEAKKLTIGSHFHRECLFLHHSLKAVWTLCRSLTT